MANSESLWSHHELRTWKSCGQSCVVHQWGALGSWCWHLVLMRCCTALRHGSSWAHGRWVHVRRNSHWSAMLMSKRCSRLRVMCTDPMTTKSKLKKIGFLTPIAFNSPGLETHISYRNFETFFLDLWTLSSAELNFIFGGAKIARQKCDMRAQSVRRLTAP